MTTVRWPRPPTLGAPHTPLQVVEASAGTGKTYFLEHKVVDLLLGTDATIDRIVVVTYTDKATAEQKLESALIDAIRRPSLRSRTSAEPSPRPTIRRIPAGSQSTAQVALERSSPVVVHDRWPVSTSHRSKPPS